MKSWSNVASKQLRFRKIMQQKYRVLAWKANFLPFYLRQEVKFYATTSHSVVQQDASEISEQKTGLGPSATEITLRIEMGCISNAWCMCEFAIGS